MIVLVPLSFFRVKFETASGRPFSRLEQLVLKGIRDGANELSGLQSTFQLHARLLIEAVVTLIQAGWVAVGSDGSSARFVLTSEGYAASGSDEVPSTTIVKNRSTDVVMERLTGGLLTTREVRVITSRDLKKGWDQAIRLTTDVTDNRLDEGQVQHLLVHRPDERVRWIGPIEMYSKGSHWMPLDVEIESGEVTGLPEDWQPRLRQLVIEDTRHIAAKLKEPSALRSPMTSMMLAQSRRSAGELEAARLAKSSWPVLIGADDLLWTSADHERAMLECLETAKTSILISSSRLSLPTVSALRDAFVRALHRGLNIDLLCGSGASIQDKDISEWLNRLNYELKQIPRVGTIRFNRTPTVSNARIVLWDTEAGGCGIVGSFDWLSYYESALENRLNLSVTVQRAEVVAALARCAAGIWAASGAELTGTADRWRTLAYNLEAAGASRPDAAATNANATISLVLDRGHETFLRERLSTDNDVVVVSRTLDHVGETRLVGSRLGGSSARKSLKVLYGNTVLDADSIASLRQAVQPALLSHAPAINAGVVVGKQCACVSGCSFLGGSELRSSPLPREVGISIDGSEPTRWIWTRIAEHLDCS